MNVIGDTTKEGIGYVIGYVIGSGCGVVAEWLRSGCGVVGCIHRGWVVAEWLRTFDVTLDVTFDVTFDVTKWLLP